MKEFLNSLIELIKMRLISCSFLYLMMVIVNAQTLGSFVDDRDDQTYETVTYVVPDSSRQISDHDEYATYVRKSPQGIEITLDEDFPSTITWMSQNLNYDTENSKCKYPGEQNCEPHGRLYTWEAAMKACPQGWRLPTDDEWLNLVTKYDSAFKNNLRKPDKEKLLSADIYKVLIQGGTTDFSGRLGGYKTGSRYTGKGSTGGYWSNSKIDDKKAASYNFSKLGQTFSRSVSDISLGKSCRCIQD